MRGCGVEAQVRRCLERLENPEDDGSRWTDELPDLPDDDEAERGIWTWRIWRQRR